MNKKRFEAKKYPKDDRIESKKKKKIPKINDK
jgi:hypothetical protein